MRLDALLAVFALLSAPALGQDVVSCRVVSIADGDTLICLTAAKEQIKVRLAEIDAPEKRQAFGERSKQSLAELCHKRQAQVRVVDRDRYGRTVGRVICAGIDANIVQVRRGMAWVYDRYARDPVLPRLQANAKATRTGLWADAEPVAPWEWRKGAATSSKGSDVRTASLTAPAAAQPIARGLTCGSKRTCGQMSTCAEARFHLAQCGVSGLDRNHDGVPCEALCR
ncbi:thermonuclease family protein [Azoarcus sp. PA01]|nr:thermonuclease family protein [Azoarcus sp. PA01]